ncbi:MAG TPA: phosphoglycerate mutase family protein, partial [Candidatus Deferrimicrobium sp.]
MRIYLVRHSEAVDRVPAMPDGARHLSARGRASFREMARRFRDAGGDPTRIFSSPLVRAVQTAEILSETLRYGGEV